MRRGMGRGLGGGSRLVMAAVMVVVGLVSYYGSRQKNPITGKTQTIALNPRQEVALGLRTAPQMAQKFGGLDTDREDQERVAAVGQKLVINSEPFTLIGVTPPSFTGVSVGVQPDLWLPMAMNRQIRRGTLNWYRNFERNWQRTEALAELQVEQPTLFLLGEHDPVGRFEAPTLKRMGDKVPHLERHDLPGAGHWLQAECGERVSALLLDFLARNYR